MGGGDVCSTAGVQRQVSFALADCNNFYVSCERVFNPALSGKPVVVLSSNDGCVISRSEEAKAAGITMGQPLFKARDLINKHGIVVLSSNYALYGSMSRRVMEVLAGFRVGREVYSIDEAFLELPEMDEPAAVALCAEMRSRVLQWTGIPISIGIGETKTLAKVANRLVKKTAAEAGVVSLLEEKRRDGALAAFPVGDVWGVGHGIRKALEVAGVTTAAQLRDVDRFWMKSEFGIKGLALVLELNGQVCHRLGTASQERKEIIVTRTFGKRLNGFEQLAPAFTEFARKGAERLRATRLTARSLTAFIVMDRFQPDYQGGSSVELELEVATADAESLVYLAREALRKLPLEGREYKKGGLVLGKLSPANVVQESLFSIDLPEKGPSQSQKFKLASEALSAVNERYGVKTQRGTPASEDLWEQRREYMSPRYTTQWNELPVAR